MSSLNKKSYYLEVNLPSKNGIQEDEYLGFSDDDQDCICREVNNHFKNYLKNHLKKFKLASNISKNNYNESKPELKNNNSKLDNCDKNKSIQKKKYNKK